MKIVKLLAVLAIALSSCKKDIQISDPPVILAEVPTFNNVLILGNSITRATPDYSIGWNNDWGMAATKPEYDYVHLLTSRLRKLNPEVKVSTVPTGEFETGYKTFDIAAYYAEAKSLKPDLLILRFGENIVQNNSDIGSFENKYAELIRYFKDQNPNLKILAVGSFWGNPVVDQSMEQHSKFVSLRPLLNDITNQAFGIYPNHNVAIHPSDKGMAGICDIIWDGLRGL
jgi:hypothetical protein